MCLSWGRKLFLEYYYAEIQVLKRLNIVCVSGWSNPQYLSDKHPLPLRLYLLFAQCCIDISLNPSSAPSHTLKSPSHIANVFFLFFFIFLFLPTNLQTCESCFQFSYSFISFGDVYLSESPGAGKRGIGKKGKKKMVGESKKKKRIERMRMSHQHGNRYK